MKIVQLAILCFFFFIFGLLIICKQYYDEMPTRIKGCFINGLLRS
uniref:Uncharacterized protein Vacuolar ATP synthase subunit G1 n=1 Tax=Rhizophora mucronata TaxID=61149 RepID=A0A2P2MJD0_RHIMU